MRSLVVAIICCAILRPSPVCADDKISLPPVGVWVGKGDQPDFLFDFKGDKSTSSADNLSGRPALTKEQTIPFVGFSLTRPFDFDSAYRRNRD